MISPIEEIKNRLDVVEVIGDYLKLQKVGTNYRALCPFHSDKRPSLFVSPSRQIWHCFGCGAGFNLFDFVMKIEGVEFADALRILARKAGIELKPISRELQIERQRLSEICQLASRFFETQLQESQKGKMVKKYLQERGLTEESIKKWHLGYAPDTWESLSKFLVSKGYQNQEIEKAGLSLKSEKTGNFLDRFRGRIIFPIFDLNSQVIGFGGRIFDQEEGMAKYVNTPNTPLYDKSRVLYGLDKAKMAIREKKECIIVEGYLDTILSHQAGTENVVATSGTALTPYQLKFIKRYTDNLLTSFDRDLAGESATKRGIDTALAQGFNIQIITLPKGSDPADIISKNPQDWLRKISEKKPILDFYFESALSRFEKKSLEGKKEISKIILPVIKKIPNKIEQSHWIQKLAREIEVREEDIYQELKKIKEEKEFYPQEEVSLPKKSRKEILEERLAALAIKSPANLQLINEKDFQFFSPKISQTLLYLKENQKAKIDSELADFLGYLSLKAEVELEEEGVEEFKKSLREIKILEIKNKLAEISKEIKKREEEKKSQEIEKLIREFNHYSKNLQDLENMS